MKALFNRTFNRSSSLKDKDGSAAATAHALAAAVATKEKTIPNLPPLPEWPPPSHRPPSSASQPSLKPLPDYTSRPLPAIQDNNLPPTLDTASDPGTNSRAKHRGPPVNGSGNADVQKKVAFLSPPSTPSPTPVRPSDASDRKPSSGVSDAPPKSNVSRLQAAHGADIRSSSPGATSSKTNLASSINKPGLLSSRATTTRVLATPQRGLMDTTSIRSDSPYSTQSANTSRILATASWSEAAEEDLVSNLGPRERTRQEVLWEIVASEERYVAEIIKLKETFIDPLLHPFATSPIATPTLPPDDDYYLPRHEATSPHESLDRLPIAARFLSPLSFEGPSLSPPHIQGSTTPVIDGDSLDSDEEDDRVGKGYEASSKLNHPRSPYRARNTSAPSRNGKIMPFPSRSHHSLPPPPRPDQHAASTASLGRQSYVGPSAEDRKATSTPAQRVIRKLRKSQNGPPVEGAIAPHLLPDDLRQCLEVIESGILNGHLVLSEGLRKRYDEQYPLVRSLADVFVSNSHILREYATYVLHLERALEQVDDALTLASVTKRPKKQTEAEWLKLSKYLQRLEEIAADKGETGLAISLSKPFQRLLKYPLLFQNLLFHTDPSTFEYESTLQMVAEVETIVRSIEDEKIQKEERDRTRDVFARIEGLEKVRQLAIFKPSRLLVEEKMFNVMDGGREFAASPPPKPSSPPPANKNVKGKSSFRRLSDVLQPSGTSGVGGKKDLWLVVFNDVVLRCQRTGTTSLPLVSATTGVRANSLPDLQGGKSKYATTGRRNSHTKPRNMYKFIRIENWAMVGDAVKPRTGIVSMEDISRSRALVSSTSTPKQPVELEEDEDVAFDSDDSDRKSKMSFSYWGADKVTLSHPAINAPKTRTPLGRGNTRGRTIAPSSYTSRESSANAKFGSRLVHSTDSPPYNRPASRKATTPALQPSKRAPVASTEDAKSTITSASKPIWDGSTRATSTSTTTTNRRPRNLSQGSSSQPVRLGKLASPAPSEDSGVGLYRQMMAQDPSLNC
ncbi:Dbl-like domain-containing protein [Hysterangium stoloniferum]|nr:Dbl-like domain-containing protein [Hysterangium stoloniferum]